MKSTLLLIALTLLALVPLPSCKATKKIEVTQKKAADTAPLLRTDIWQGTEDRIDPQLGALKTLDK